MKLVLTLGLLASIVTCASAGYSVTILNPPSSIASTVTGSYVYGINNAGSAVGNWTTVSGFNVPAGWTNPISGGAGNFTIAVPSGFTGAVAYGINSSGHVVGQATRALPAFPAQQGFYQNSLGCSVLPTTTSGTNVLVPEIAYSIADDEGIAGSAHSWASIGPKGGHVVNMHPYGYYYLPPAASITKMDTSASLTGSYFAGASAHHIVTTAGGDFIAGSTAFDATIPVPGVLDYICASNTLAGSAFMTPFYDITPYYWMSFALGSNSSLTTCGYVEDDTSGVITLTRYPFVRTSSGVTTILSTTSTGVANSINSVGEVVGNLGGHAFYYNAGSSTPTLVNLDPYAVAAAPVGTVWHLLDATCINDIGWIVCNGTVKVGTGATVPTAFLLKPTAS